MTELRAKARKSGVYLRVLKNTLARRAVEGTPFAGLSQHMKGPLVYGISPDAVATAKVLNEFAKANEKLVIRAGAMENAVISPKEVTALASLPSRDELLAKLLGTMQAPIAKFARTLNEVPARFARTLAAVRAGTSLSVRANLAIGACIVPSSFASNSSREGIEASAVTSFGEITAFSIAPARMTSFSLALANSLSTFAVATASGEMPYTSGPFMCWDSPANGVPSTARRARVFLRTRRYTPDLRAFARNSVMRPTSRPRYSATTIALAFASCAETSATIAFFFSMSRPKVYLQFSKPRVRLAAPTATLHSGISCLGFAICVGRRDAFRRLSL